jgi:hypothetical protein
VKTLWMPFTLLALLCASPLRAQEPPASATPPPETTPAATPAPAPTPLPLLMSGPALETLKQLAATLRTEVGHAVEGAQAAAAAGRPTRVFMPGLRMFARRTEWFARSVEGYRTQPFDVVGTATMMRGRATMLNRRVRNSAALQHTFEDWDLAVDALDRIQKLLAGQTVTVPPPHTPRPLPAATPVPAATPTPAPSPTPR